MANELRSMKKIVLIFLFLFPLFAVAQKTDKKLQAKLKEAISGYNGDIGIYVKNLRTGKTVSINADTIFPDSQYCKSADTAGYNW